MGFHEIFGFDASTQSWGPFYYSEDGATGSFTMYPGKGYVAYCEVGATVSLG